MNKNENLNSYDKIIKLVKNFAVENKIKQGVRISRSSLSQLNSQTKSTYSLSHSIPALPEVISFFKYVEKHVPKFNRNNLLKLSK